MTTIEPLLHNFTAVTKNMNANTPRIAISNHDLTPSKGFIAEATRYAHEHKTSIDVLINTKQNTYHYNDIELKIMEADILECQELGVDGIFIGALTKDNEIDVEAMQTLIAAAGGMEITFNLAFNKIIKSKYPQALKWLKENYIDKVLASENFKEIEPLTKKANITLIPYTNDENSLQKVNKDFKPIIILNNEK